MQGWFCLETRADHVPTCDGGLMVLRPWLEEGVATVALFIYPTLLCTSSIRKKKEELLARRLCVCTDCLMFFAQDFL